MAALPPDFKLEEPEDDKDEGRFLKLPPGATVHVVKEPTLAETAWKFVGAVALFLAIAAAGAYIVMQCWNTLTGVTGLPYINWQEAFCALVLLRVTAMVSLPFE